MQSHPHGPPPFPPAAGSHYPSSSAHAMAAALAAAQSSTSHVHADPVPLPPLPPLPPPFSSLPQHQAPLRNDLLAFPGVEVAQPLQTTYWRHTPMPLTPISSLPPPLPKRKAVVAPAAGALRRPTPGARRRKPRAGPPRFFCQLAGCGKAFRMQGDLSTHMRIHTGDEPFHCRFPNCDRRYKWRSSLSHHEGLHRSKKGALTKRKPRRSKAVMLMDKAELDSENDGGGLPGTVGYTVKDVMGQL